MGFAMIGAFLYFRLVVFTSGCFLFVSFFVSVVLFFEWASCSNITVLGSRLSSGWEGGSLYSF
ncbi:hypothetical protein BJ508DRAFT_121881 [Ascobolus immersus RN42]|uniref:Uncharacterized protein n=1 Tax=Ascobolus immersus RN42 TaxID=1160509 RepID=A0A3N4IRQ7_ASCIM|nr:hypothetical protein BJ508DRAFT_121881 [Ascobolus immersus RN42]